MEKIFYIFAILLLQSVLCINAMPYSENVTEEYFLLPDSQSPCLRPCEVNNAPMICRYKFQVELYLTMNRACYDCPKNETDCFRPNCITADGISRPVFVINKQMPGPSIQVCKGDEIIVNVENHLPSEETTIHWHGHHQRGTPYMDGVPHLTQCPISTGSTFQYRFKADHVGTHFWHSHTGLQRGDGAFGSMIVREPVALDPHGSLYDFDLASHIIIVLDWLHNTGQEIFARHHHSDGDNKPDALLINGRGHFQLPHKTEFMPPTTFTVQKGFRYRFRVINAEFLNCPIEISIDNHTLTVISTDGNNIEPVQVESFVTYAGERFDFILNADQDEDNYWMRFRGLMDCDERFKSVHQVAVLHYANVPDEVYPSGDPDYFNSHKDGLQMNPLNEGTQNNESVNVVELNALVPNDITLLKEKADQQFYISYDFYNISNPNFYAKNLYGFNGGHPKFKLTTPQLNHITLKLQPFPLLSQRNLITPDMFCNETTLHNCQDDFCHCTHVLQVPLDSVVELILVDLGNTFDANHPFHLHGNYFRVLGMERLGKTVTVEEIQELDRAGLIERKLDHAPLKDTITVPDGGYTIIRFHANNPGYWLFHCHIDFHAEVGMALVFKIGEHSDFPPVPRRFPECGNWIPNDDVDDLTIETTSKTTEQQTTENIYNHDVNTNFTTICNQTENQSFFSQILHQLNIENDCVSSQTIILSQPFVIIFATLTLFFIQLGNNRFDNY